MHTKYHFTYNIINWMLYVSCKQIIKVFVKRKVSPNLLTYWSVIFTILPSIMLLFRPSSISWLVVMVLLLTFSLQLDVCDGEVARNTGKISKSIIRLDHFFDLIKFNILMIALSYFHFGSRGFLISTLLSSTLVAFDYLNSKLHLAIFDKSKFSNSHSYSSNKLFTLFMLQIKHLLTFDLHIILLLIVSIFNVNLFLIVCFGLILILLYQSIKIFLILHKSNY